MPHTIFQSIIRFPEIQLQTRDAHKIRGYFGRLFEDRSPLLHNHFEDGRLRYKYPLVQYKVIDNIPMLIGLEEGASLLTSLFQDINELTINNIKYPVRKKNMEQRKVSCGYDNTLHSYQFLTGWMSLNQENYQKYTSLNESKERNAMLNRILANNILSFYKGLDIWLQDDERLMVKGRFSKHFSTLKNKKMLIFKGHFTCNCLLPKYVGLGRSASRGFGSIIKE